MVSWVQGNHAAGTAYYEEALEHLRAIGDESGIFEVVLELGKGACDAGDLARATTLFEECLALSETMRDEAGRGAVLTELGVVATLQGDHARAVDLFMQATTSAQENGDHRQIAYLATHLGDVDIATGNIGSAASRYAEALGLFLPMGNQVGIAQCLEAIARCTMLRGHVLPAIRLFGSSASLFAAIGATPPPNRDPATGAASLKSKVSLSEFVRAWDAGKVLSSAEAAAEALVLADDLMREGFIVEAPVSVDPPDPFGLTRREREVLALVVTDGLTNVQIAERLFISPKTVSTHLVSIFGKLGVTSRAAATRFAIEHRLV
jgi:DNA-binding CsgD family transcriptional regulator/tetratricopeptide (TPR) repeat protein